MKCFVVNADMTFKSKILGNFAFITECGFLPVFPSISAYQAYYNFVQ